MSVLLVVNTPPCGSEGPCNAFRLADAVAVRDQHVLGDASRVAHARVATIRDLAEATERCGRVLTF
jgi:sulfur relay (sulfurtransferase) complex TusBCD TusD component (DsrE family)